MFFAGRTLLIATKHKKETVIAPLLEKHLGVQCMVDPHLDTDLLGTFTGEVERLDDPLETARQKCLLGMERTGCDLAVASEGSFGPHPTIFFSHADDELLILIDKKNEIEIIARFLTTDTNFNALEISTKKQLIDFAKAVRFPSHALIFKKSKNDFDGIEKGINSWRKLDELYDRFMSYGPSFYVETDMRAMHNPSRMTFIEKVTEKLIAKANALCPSCQIPGFGITAVRDGLPCELCQMPTRSTLSYIYECNKCGYTQEEKYPHQKQVEEPTFCDHCNP
ncbi:MAG: hypothetical protein JNJ58_05075 [Chitinophagaceae bacterium]|nr:hypothetical protein [Chitinophagaceae bacterium]